MTIAPHAAATRRISFNETSRFRNTATRASSRCTSLKRSSYRTVSSIGCAAPAQRGGLRGAGNCRDSQASAAKTLLKLVEVGQNGARDKELPKDLSYADAIKALDMKAKAEEEETQVIEVIELDAHDLDIANGFAFVQVQINDPGVTAQLAAGLAILTGPRYGGQFPPSALA